MRVSSMVELASCEFEKCKVFSCDKEENIWCGSIDDLPTKYLKSELNSWDLEISNNEPYMVFNID